MAKCQKCGCGLDVSFSRDDRTGKLFCSPECLKKFQRRRFSRYSIAPQGESAPTANDSAAPAEPTKPPKPETQIDRWARSFERRHEEQRAAEKELATRSAEDRAQVEVNRTERAELDKLMRKYVNQTYTDAELARLRTLRAKHVF